jgi:hypothetical protein
MLISIVVVLSCVLGFVAPTAARGELVDPPWPRGAAGSTYQRWEFGTPEDEPPPEADAITPYGDPSLKVNGHEWIDMDPSLGTRQGIWALSGEIDVFLYNSSIPRPRKEVLIQIVWTPEDPAQGSPALPFQPIVGVASNPPALVVIEPPVDHVLADGWFRRDVWIRMEPNPHMEWITIKGNVLVDRLVIDTICIPEPASIALLSLGFVPLAIRRRGRRRR